MNFTLPITPRPCPFHLSPGVSHSDQLNCSASGMNLYKTLLLVACKQNTKLKVNWLFFFLFYLFCTGDRVGMPFYKFKSCDRLCLTHIGDLKAPQKHFSRALILKLLFVTGKTNMQFRMKISLTSIEQPISEPSFRAFCIIWKSRGGALGKS